MLSQSPGNYSGNEQIKTNSKKMNLEKMTKTLNKCFFD